MVEYQCREGEAFPDDTERVGIIKTAYCNTLKEWEPPFVDCECTLNKMPLESNFSADFRIFVLFSATENIAAGLEEVTESDEAVPIGMVAISLVSCLVVTIILLDLNKLYTDLKLMKVR